MHKAWKIWKMKIRQPIITVAGHVDHGKCVSGDTLIPLANGTIISAKDLFEKYFDRKKAKKEGTDLIQETDKVTIFSNYGSVILPTKISHLWKRQKKELIEIKTAHGDILKTTPEHPYFTFPIEKTKAENLEVGDYIMIPRRVKIKDSNPKKIILKNLKDYNFLCYLNLNSKELREKIRKKGIEKIGQKLSIKHLGDSLRKARLRFQDLLKLCEHFKISEIEIYEMIGAIKNSTEKQRAGHTSKVIKFPDFHDPEKLGYILGCIAGDGHLDKTRVLLDNNDLDIQKKYSEYLKEIFNIESSVKQNHTCQTVVNNGGLTFKRFVKDLIGFPDKQKSAKIEVPEIAQKNKEIFKGFFSGLIDTDGYVSHLNHCIELTSKSRQLIKQCSMLLLNLEIQSVVYEKKGFYVLRIANKKYLDKFLENFTLRLKRKLKRVIKASEKAQSSRVFDIVPIDKEEIKKLKLPSKPNKVIPYFNKYIKSQNLTRGFLEKVLENITKENTASWKIKNLLESDVKYVKVISKRRLKNKEKYVYDFTVPGTHNFVAERTVVHNTTILDSIRNTGIAEGEAGGITQKISFTLFPADKVMFRCPLLNKHGIKLDIPGFLYIDTPGHAAFTNLRKRGGSLADLAILVIDINEGIKPQTAEVIEILKHNKTPFIIALNKIDNISGWQNLSEDLKESIDNQAENVKQDFLEKLYRLQGSLHSHGFNAVPYWEVKDFSTKLALVPCSGKTGEGIPELLMMMCGLSQKFLKGRLSLGKQAKGVILEVKKEKSINYIEAILYDGKLKRDDEIAIASFDKVIKSKIRILENVVPLSSKFEPAMEVLAATGIRMQLTTSEKVLSGMPFQTFKSESEIQDLSKEVSKEIELDKEGIIVKADSLGSLEALILLLKQENIKINKAGIGPITKTDFISAQTNLETTPLNAIIAGFNVQEDQEVLELSKQNEKIKILKDDVIYKLIENLQEFREQKQNEIKREKLMKLATICKLKILPEHVFHNSNPAIFGVAVEGGTLKRKIALIDNDGKDVAKVKATQVDGKPVEETKKGQEVALSLPGISFDRRLKDTSFLFSNIGEAQFREFKANKDLLSQEEIQILQEIAEIKRREKVTWGV